MKQFIKQVKTLSASMVTKVTLAYISIMGIAHNAVAQNLPKTDLTKDTSGGKKFDDVANNLNNAAQTGASLMIQLVAIGGFVVVAISLYTLWKASKDEREKPMSAVVGLFIGGAMAGVSTVMWMMKNTVVG